MKRLAAALQSVYSWLEQAFAVAAGSIAIGLMMFTVITTLLRYLLHKPFGPTLDFTELTIPVIVFLGLAYTQKMGKHLSVDVLIEHLHGRWRMGIMAIALIASLFFFAMVFWYGWEYALYNLLLGDKTIDGFPTWPSTMMIPVGSLFICIRIIIQLVSLPSLMKDKL